MIILKKHYFLRWRGKKRASSGQKIGRRWDGVNHFTQRKDKLQSLLLPLDEQQQTVIILFDLTGC